MAGSGQRDHGAGVNFPSRGGGFRAKHPAMFGRSWLACTLTLMVVAGVAVAENFIRVDEDGKAVRLQTAVTRYQKDASTVDLIGAIHIADPAYYQQLNTRFKDYDALLFEMIGGEKIGRQAPAAEEPAAPAPGKKERDLSGLHRIYDKVASFLKLTGQADAINYQAPNFIHADLTNAEFNQLQHERGESLLGFAIKAGRAAPEPSQPPDSLKLLQALLSGKANRIKLEIVHTLGQGDDQIAALAGSSVIISERNRRCLEVMSREMAAGHKNLGIFYGAAHFPDLEKRLLEQGFRRERQEWLTAWHIPKAAAAKLARQQPSSQPD